MFPQSPLFKRLRLALPFPFALGETLQSYLSVDFFVHSKLLKKIQSDRLKSK